MSEFAPIPPSAGPVSGPAVAHSMLNNSGFMDQMGTLKLGEMKPLQSAEELNDSFYDKLETVQGLHEDPLLPMQEALEMGQATSESMATNLVDAGVTLDEMEAVKYTKRNQADARLKGNGGDGDQAAIDKDLNEAWLINGITEKMIAAGVDGWDANPERRAAANRVATEKGEAYPFPEEAEAIPTSQVQPEQTTQSEAINFKAHTFEEAEQLKKGLSNEFIDGLLNDHLKSSAGETTLLKNYLDHVPATPEDIEFTTSADKMSKLHQETRDMIAENLKIAVAPNSDPRMAAFLSVKKKEYLDQLDAGSDTAKQFFHDIVDGNKKVSAADINLGSIAVPTDRGAADILDVKGSVPGIRPNIRIQHELAGEFIHWSSDKYAQAKARGELKDTEMTKRIYLNPAAEDNVKLFSVIMTAANEAGMKVHGKMLDRCLESAGETRRVARGEAMAPRADGIVLYADEAQANELLSMVEALANDTAASFKGRAAAKVPVTVAEGIAVGSEPIADKGTESLTSHREKALIATKEATKQQLGLESYDKIPQQLMGQARVIFRAQFHRIALANQINPDNFAFNTTSVKPNVAAVLTQAPSAAFKAGSFSESDREIPRVERQRPRPDRSRPEERRRER